MNITAVGALLAAAVAQADFQAALHEYNAGHYDSAHKQFMALAELGDCTSQFNLGAMALKGQGGPVDTGSGVGWLEAAAGNGCEQLAGGKLAALKAKLSGDESRTAAAVVARFGHEALRTQGIVDPDFSCRDLTPAHVTETPVPESPHHAEGRAQTAIVITALTIGIDGHARDPEIVLAVPEQGFAAAAVEAWLNSLFTPASHNGQRVESRLQAKLLFEVRGGGTLATAEAFARARPAADAGEPAAAYLVGLAGTVEASLGLTNARAGQLLIGSARDGNPQAQYWVGNQLRHSAPCHPGADGTVWLQHAADNGSAAAQLALAADLLGAAPSAGQVARARALLEQAAASDSFYVRKHVAALLAASPLEAARDPQRALAVARQLAGGEIQSDPQMFEVIAAAYAASGDFRNASAQQQAAIRKARDLGWDTRAMEERSAAYRRGAPWRGDLLPMAPAGARATH
jgi:TPR repeat protein